MSTSALEQLAAANPATDLQADVTGAFKAAMRRLAATVTIVTALSEQGPVGIAATAVISLTMDPPALLVAINRNTSIHPLLTNGAQFCVNILGAAHAELCNAFGAGLRQEERFRFGEWCAGEGDVPRLRDAEANVICRVDQTTGYGTHTIVIGRVMEVRLNEPSLPLVYGYGRILDLAPPP